MILSKSHVEYDYDNISYPIPFNELYHSISTHYVDYGKPNPRLPPYIGTGDIEDDAFGEDNMIVVTGSSENHVLANVNMMYSVIYTNCHLSMVFVDFGLEEEGLAYLTKHMTRMHFMFQKLNSTAKLYYRKFNFANFPSWFNISDRSIRGGYSWKVVSYFDVLNQTKRIVVWSDGGNRWSHSIYRDTKHMSEDGFYSPYSGGVVQSWVHPKTQYFLITHHMIRKVYNGKGMCTGGYVFVNYRNAKAMHHIFFPLLQCAYTRRCISPYGTNRRNHRQDQAILTVLVHNSASHYACAQRYPTMTSFHRDCHEPTKCNSMQKGILKMISHRYDIPLNSEIGIE